MADPASQIAMMSWIMEELERISFDGKLTRNNEPDDTFP